MHIEEGLVTSPHDQIRENERGRQKDKARRYLSRRREVTGNFRGEVTTFHPDAGGYDRVCRKLPALSLGAEA
ncbi:MAG TPA: hypothetical protein VK581_13785, partial [Chthoniobacterales bacterium]|nr:hypothetical protein [Chthoniobacterales bacterium]